MLPRFLLGNRQTKRLNSSFWVVGFYNPVLNLPFQMPRFLCRFVSSFYEGEGNLQTPQEERNALLQYKATSDPNSDALVTWVDDETSDCCTWELLKCNTTTGRLIELYVNVPFKVEGASMLNASLFLPFKQLQVLDLARNFIEGWYKNEGFERLGELKQLKVLNLQNSHFDSLVLPSLSAITSLTTLDLYSNSLWFGASPESYGAIGKLSKLEVLNLKCNSLNNNILPLLGPLTSLKRLNLGENQLEGSLSEYSRDMELSQPATTQGEKSQTRWNPKMDEILINVLMDEYAMGNKKDGKWTHESLKRVANEVNTRVNRPGLAPIATVNVRARLKTFREQYMQAKHAISQSGFEFNNETKCVDADPVAWEEYIKAFPKAKKLRGNPMPYYLDFAILLGDDVANGSLNVEGSDDLDADNTPRNEPPITLLDDNGGIQPPIGNSFEHSNHVKKSTPKRNRAKLTSEVQHIGESMKAIASAASDMAMAFKSPDYSSICNEISQIPGLTESEVIRAMDMFWKNKELPNFFSGLAPSLRRGWIRMKLGNNEVSDNDL